MSGYLINPSIVGQGYTGIGAPDFTSSQITLSTGSSSSVNHSLGQAPDLSLPFLECISAEGGYSVGDLVAVNVLNAENTTGSPIYARQGVSGFNTTQCFHVTGADGYFLPNKTTGVEFQANLASNWRLVFKAWSSLTPDFTSSDITPLVANAKMSASHSLPLTPALVMAELECLAVDKNYAVGDVISFFYYAVYNSGNASETFRNFIIGVDGTECYLINSGGYLAPDKVSGNHAGGLNVNNWELRFKAWNLVKPAYESPLITPVLGSQVEYTHGVPVGRVALMTVDLINVTAEHGYVPGDRITLNAGDIDGINNPPNNSDNYAVGYDDTEAWVTFCPDSISVIHKTAFTHQTITLANWRVQFRLWGE